MATKIIMPGLSQTTDEVHLIDWYIKEGDRVKKGDFLCEVETDKVTTDVESFADGTVLKLLVAPDTVVKAGEVIAILGEPGEEVEDIEGDIATEKNLEGSVEKELAKEKGKAVEEKNKERLGAESIKVNFSNVKASTIVKNLAKKNSIDLTNIKGSGPGGLITRKDLEEYIEFVRSRKKEAISEKEIVLSPRQKEVAKNLTESKKNIPHYMVTVRVWVDRLLKVRERVQDRSGKRITYDSIFIYVISRALGKYPHINGYFYDNKLIMRESVNVGFAVSREWELFVPVIKDADRKSIEVINDEVIEVLDRIKKGNVNLRDFTGGSITISNLGMYSVDSFTAIIPPKQSCIIAIGETQKALYIDEMDSMRIRKYCNITGSFDHRIINGAEAAEFLTYVKEIIEEEL